MKTIFSLVLIIGLAVVGFVYRHELAIALKRLKRPSTVQEAQPPAVADTLAEGTNTMVIESSAPTNTANRLDQIMGKMTTSLMQLDKPADVSTPPLTAQHPNETQTAQLPVDESAAKYSRLWDKLQRNQKTINP